MKFGQRPPRLERLFQTYQYPVYFVTFCTHARKSWLACVEVHEAFGRFAERARDFDIAVGRYVIMPDHVHLFVRGGPDFILGKWIGSLKQCLAKAAGCLKSDGLIWQEGFFDHTLRGDESMTEKWNYVCEKSCARTIGQQR